MLAVDEAAATEEATSHRDLEGIELAHVELVREQIRRHVAQARAHERAASDLWRRTLELIGEATGQEIPPSASLLDVEGGGLRLDWSSNGSNGETAE